MKNFKDFIKERLSNNTLYSAANKAKEQGHPNLKKKILSKINKIDIDIKNLDIIGGNTYSETNTTFNKTQYYMFNGSFVDSYIENNNIEIEFEGKKYFSIFKLEFNKDGFENVSDFKLLHRKDVKVFIKILQIVYSSNDDISYKSFKYKFHNLFYTKDDLHFEEDLTSKIPDMFNKYKRSFYTDVDINRVKSETTINKFNL